jgi:hypothetical protein
VVGWADEHGFIWIDAKCHEGYGGSGIPPDQFDDADGIRDATAFELFDRQESLFAVRGYRESRTERLVPQDYRLKKGSLAEKGVELLRRLLPRDRPKPRGRSAPWYERNHDETSA